VAGRRPTKLVKVPIWAGPYVGNDESLTVAISSVSAPSITILRLTGTGTIING
jgi:hypothetical protein